MSTKNNLKTLDEISALDQELGRYDEEPTPDIENTDSLLQKIERNIEGKDYEEANRVADIILVESVANSMTARLEGARALGRHGWWNPDVCSIEYLTSLRDNAIKDNDHISVLNFTAMIAIRESNLKED